MASAPIAGPALYLVVPLHVATIDRVVGSCHLEARRRSNPTGIIRDRGRPGHRKKSRPAPRGAIGEGQGSADHLQNRSPASFGDAVSPQVVQGSHFGVGENIVNPSARLLLAIAAVRVAHPIPAPAAGGKELLGTLRGPGTANPFASGCSCTGHCGPIPARNSRPAAAC